MLGAILALCLIGLAQIYSATGGPTGDLRDADLRHRARAGGAGRLPQHRLPVARRQVALHLSAASSLLLVYVLFFGVVRGGSRRWIDLGPLNLQPSEFAKAALALVLAKFFGESRRGARHAQRPADRGRDHRRAARSSSRSSPTSGTAVDAAARAASPWRSWPACRCGSSASWRSSAVLAAPIAWKFALQDYQKERISTFLDPRQDARGAGYQQIQARITVGSGGPWGKGFQKGTQGQLRFLPVAHNDFIFSVLAEEHGFAGVLVALGLYLFVILRVARGGPAGQGPARRVPGAGSAGQLHVPGDVQHHDVGRPGAGQRSDASAHELRRLLHDCHAGGIRPDSQRADATIYELRAGGPEVRLYELRSAADLLGAAVSGAAAVPAACRAGACGRRRRACRRPARSYRA